ncbi:MAG: aldehyde dehydrogenase family protein, partial [Frankiales bacterium]|nr:aldehyde dehydrogenase family protein [Frankiales bacterium]
MERVQNFVAGRFTDAASGQTLTVVDPATGEGYATAPLSAAADVDAAVRSAASAFETWRDATPAERATALLKAADALERRADEFVQAECRNTGKPQ